MHGHDPGWGTGPGEIHCTDHWSRKDGRAEIDAHAAEWLKESDVPSVAVAWIEDRKVAWTTVYGEQSPGVAGDGKNAVQHGVADKAGDSGDGIATGVCGKISLDESMSPFWLDPDIKDDPWSKLLTPRLCLSHQTGFANWRRMTGGVLKIDGSREPKQDIRERDTTTLAGLSKRRWQNLSMHWRSRSYSIRSA